MFLDIGGVLLTDGWDHHARKRAAKRFKLDWAEMEKRHNLNFGIFESGKLTLEKYLSMVVFYQKRLFSRSEFRRFMFTQSTPYPDLIKLICKLKANYGLKIAVVSNEARELNAYRIRKFKLSGLQTHSLRNCFRR
jgi:putative hydrolase of the HAD superfamily